MLTTHFLNKHSLFLLIALLVIQAGRSQSHSQAAALKTWFLDNKHPVTIPAPPPPDKTELQSIKQRVALVDDKKKGEIKYWDAGVPSYRWNQIAPKLISYEKIDVLLRMPSSWMNMAIHDATILAWKEKIKYKRNRPHISDPSLKPIINAPSTYSYPCEHSVTAAAAATVLAYFYPEKGDSILQLARAASQSRIDAGVQFPSDVEAGWKLGEQVARQVIEKAKADGSAKPWDGKVNKDPKKWTGSYPLGITAASFVPMVMRTPDQFRPPPPPDFEAEMNELKKYKPNFKSTSLAYYWANTSMELWIDLANQKLFEYRMADDAIAVARVYTVLSVASHDATISIMDAKYAYWGLRPNQYDTTYKSLLLTPPFPGYPSGHAAGSSTAATVLEYFFPAHAREFQKLAKDCADSRFYAGIHFRSDNETGLRMGQDLGKYVAETLIKK